MASTTPTSLAGFLAEVREELETAHRQREADNKPPLFELDTVDIEVQFVLGEQEGGKGGLNLQVLSLGAHKNVNTSTVHKARLHLKIAESARRTNVPGARPHPGSKGAPADDDFKPV